MANLEIGNMNIKIKADASGMKTAGKAIKKFQEDTQRRAEKMNRLKISPVARILDRVSGPAKKIEANLNRLSKKTVTVLIKAKDMTRGAIDKIMSPLTLLGAGAGVAGGIIYPLKLAGEMDRYRKAIVNFSASAEEGQKNFEDLINFAIKSPVYDVPFVAQMGGRLLAISKDLDFTKRSLELFGNTMMYTGATLDDVKFAFRGYQQIAAKGKLQMEELYQVTENLNVPLAWVAEELGVTGDQLSDLGRLGIPAKKAMDAILRTLEKRFPKANFNEDLLALVSNTKETARMVVWQFGEGMAKPVIRIFQDITGSLDPTGKKYKDFTDKVKRAGEIVGDGFEKAYKEARIFFDELTNSRAWQNADWGGRVAILLGGVAAAMTNWVAGPGGAAAAAMGAAIGKILAEAAVQTFNGAMMDHPILRTVAAGYAGGKIAGPWGVIGAVTASGVAEIPIQVGKSAARREAEQRERIAEPGRVVDEFRANPSKYYVEGGTIGPSKKQAFGNIITSPTHALIGEAGPELVLPLSQRMRNRALDLWQQAGQYLGVRPYAEGGFAGPVPAIAGAGGTTIINVYMDGAVQAQFEVNNDGDVDRAANQAAYIITQKLKDIFTNKA